MVSAGDHFELLPPYTIEDHHVDFIVSTLHRSLTEAISGLPDQTRTLTRQKPYGRHMQTTRCQFLRLAILFQVVMVTGGKQFPLRGFTPTHSQTERELEERFIQVPNPERAEAVHKTLTAEPHMAGSPGDRRTAEYVLQQFREFGLEAEIEEFETLLSNAREIKFQLLGPVRSSEPNPEYVAGHPASKDPAPRYDWRSFFTQRVYSINPRAPLGGLERSGWGLVFTDVPNEFLKLLYEQKRVDATYSIGLRLKE